PLGRDRQPACGDVTTAIEQRGDQVFEGHGYEDDGHRALAVAELRLEIGLVLAQEVVIEAARASLRDEEIRAAEAHEDADAPALAHVVKVAGRTLQRALDDGRAVNGRGLFLRRLPCGTRRGEHRDQGREYEAPTDREGAGR